VNELKGEGSLQKALISANLYSKIEDETSINMKGIQMKNSQNFQESLKLCYLD